MRARKRPESVVLLTGASGLVGGDLLPRLLAAKPGAWVVAPTRRPERGVGLAIDPRVRAVDLDLAGNGWAESADSVLEAWRPLVTEIIHCAAETRFDLPLEDARAANVGMARHLLAFARGCPRLRSFAHVSTLYVYGQATGRLPEAPARRNHPFSNTYQQSKYEAEEVVLRAAATDLPARVFRLGSIIGDSVTGCVNQYNYVHQLIRLLPRNVLPVAPIDPSAPVDLIASDWAADALTHLILRPVTVGGVYHLCAGEAESLTAGEMIDLTIKSLRAADPSGRFDDIRLPEYVGVREFREYVEKKNGEGDRLLKELLRVVGYSLPHLGLYQAFENGNAVMGLAGSGIALPPIRDYYDKVVRYCVRKDWGRGRGGAGAGARGE